MPQRPLRVLVLLMVVLIAMAVAAPLLTGSLANRAASFRRLTRLLLETPGVRGLFSQTLT